MGKPIVRRRAVPMFYSRGNVYDSAFFDFDGFFSLFLIISAAANSYQYLSAARFGMVNMPIISALRLEGNIEDFDLGIGNPSQITLSRKIFCIGVIWFANREHYGFRVCFFFGFRGGAVGPYRFCQIKRRSGFWPTCIKCVVSDYCGNLRL